MKRITRAAVLFAGAFLFFVSFANAQDKTFKANLMGKNEVPPVDSSATGHATFRLSGDGKSLMYTLSVSNIEDVTMAHIHIGDPGQAGQPVAPLYPSKMASSMDEKKDEMTEKQDDMGKAAMQKMNGIIAKGTIQASSLMGPFKGKTIADLVEQIQSGKAYVNVHTKGHPGGEIRGTIQ